MSDVELLGALPFLASVGAAARARSPRLRRLLDRPELLRFRLPRPLGSRSDRSDALERHAVDYTSPEGPALAGIARTTQEFGDQPYMMIGAVKAQLLATLVHAVRARNVLEIGTFTGYSAVAMAAALPPGGRIVTCEVDPARAEAARRHVAEAGFAERVTVAEGPALETVARLDGPFDLVFVDADKTGYLGYFHAVLPKLGDHGLIVVDNTLHEGLAAYDDGSRRRSAALHEFNRAVRDDPRVVQVVLPLHDGFSLIRRA